MTWFQKMNPLHAPLFCIDSQAGQALLTCQTNNGRMVITVSNFNTDIDRDMTLLLEE